MEGTPKTTKRRLVKKSENKVEKKLKKEPEDPVPPQPFDDGGGSDSDSEDLPKLLEPFTKTQLIELICSTALKDSNLQAQIRAAADRDVTHRKIFVHGLGWDTTRETLTSVFEPFGEIEDCNVVMDKNTGKAKGYGFILFKSRQGATKALKEPRKKISNRMVSCQLASMGSAPPPTTQSQEAGPRKIYVANVHHNVDAERLRAFFAKFGELEMGPIGFDSHTGKSKGYAIFIYRTSEGARKALEEPHKVFEGSKLHCQRASEGKNKNQNSTQAVQSFAQSQPPPVMAAMAAAPNMQLFSQHHPVYGGFGNSALGGGMLNHGVVPMSQMGLVGSSAGAGIGGLGSYSAGSYGLSQLSASGSSLLGSYGLGSSSLKGYPHIYSSSMLGKSISDSGPTAAGGSIGGYTSHLWPDY